MSDAMERWRAAMRERYRNRECGDLIDAWDDVWAPLGLPRSAAEDALRALEDEFGIPAGCFRPEDELDGLFRPLPSRSLFERIANEIRAGDAQLDLHLRLGEKLESSGLRDAWHRLHTVGDFARAWSGLPPQKGER